VAAPNASNVEADGDGAAAPNASKEDRLPVLVGAAANVSNDERLAVGDPNASNGVDPACWLLVFAGAATGELAKPKGSLVAAGVAFTGLNPRKSFLGCWLLAAGGVATETGGGGAANAPNAEPGGGASVNDPVLNSLCSGGAAAGLGVLLNPKSPKPPAAFCELVDVVGLSNRPKSSKSFCCFLGGFSKLEKSPNAAKPPVLLLLLVGGVGSPNASNAGAALALLLELLDEEEPKKSSFAAFFAPPLAVRDCGCSLSRELARGDSYCHFLSMYVSRIKLRVRSPSVPPLGR
jgi:hypothetical protein